MVGETDLKTLLRSMTPVLNNGDYVFCCVPDLSKITQTDLLACFREREGYTVIIDKAAADRLQLKYNFIAAWITLTVHSSLEAVGLTAAFSKALSDHGISCNVVAAYYHDHIFVPKQDADKAMHVLIQLSASS